MLRWNTAPRSSEAQMSKGKGAGRKVGRDKVKCARYRAMHIAEKNKAKRVLQSSGVAYAEAWAAKNGVSGVVASLIAKGA